MEFNPYCAYILIVFLPLVTAFDRGLFKRKKLPPIDGSWSSWESWSSCYKNSPTLQHYYPPWKNFHVQSRNRSCSSPKPLFGGKDCEPPSHRYRQCSCMNPLIGSDANPMRDTQLSASNYLIGYPPSEARFSNKSKGWCSKSRLSYFRQTYIQIDFRNFTNVGAIATLDNLKGRTSRFKLKYSLNGRTWNYIDNDKVFSGNYLRGKSKMNHFRNPQVMKYLRLIPTQSYGFPCVKIEAFGCVFTCGGLLTMPYGELTARSSVDIDQNCLWRVEVLNTTSLTFDFSIFYVLCEYGYLEFRDSNFPFTKAPLLKRICLSDSASEVPALNINRNSVWINFVSNSSSSEVGFNIKYLSKCSQTISLERGESISIKSPNYPNNYFHNLNCKWSIIPPNAVERFEVTINDFSIEGSNSSSKVCSDDILVFDIEVNNLIKNYASYCNNNRPPQKLVIHANKLFITFKSDLVTSDKGFSISIISGLKSVSPAVTNAKAEKMTTSSSITVITSGAKYSEFQKRNNSIHRQKVKVSKDDTWTVIIICTFSSLVVLLIGVVLYMNIKRFINNRDEVNAQCAKAAAAEEKKKKKVVKKDGSNSREKEALIPQKSNPVQKIHNDQPDNPLIVSVSLNNSSSEDDVGLKDVNHSKNGHCISSDVNQSPDEVDGENVENGSCGISSEASSPVASIVINCESLDHTEESVL